MARNSKNDASSPTVDSSTIGSVLVTGARGLLGGNLCPLLHASAHRVSAYARQELDITQTQAVSDVLQAQRPDIVVNCAGFTDVDGSQTQPQTAHAVNEIGTLNLARLCRQIGAKLVYISTDYVFDGKLRRPYREDDKPNPINVYGASKWAGEEHVRSALSPTTAGKGGYLIVRSSWLFGAGGNNFVDKILKTARRRSQLEVVDDQVGCPTYCVDLAQALLTLIAGGATGTWHCTNSGHCSWYDFACEIVRQARLNCPVRPITSQSLAQPAPRPAWSVLDIAKYNNIVPQAPRLWQEALAAYLTARD